MSNPVWVCKECFDDDCFDGDRYPESSFEKRGSVPCAANVSVDEDGDTYEGDFEPDWNGFEAGDIECSCCNHELGSYIDKDSDLVRVVYDADYDKCVLYDEDEDEDENEEDDVSVPAMVVAPLYRDNKRVVSDDAIALAAVISSAAEDAVVRPDTEKITLNFTQ